METSLWIVAGLSSLCWLVSWAMFARFRAVPTRAERGGPPEVRISVVIPARNEEENIARLLRSLQKQQFAPHEIIVVDDQSEDRTGACAGELGARVIVGEALPDGWLGKPWACQQGAREATGDWLLFLDADTEFETDGLGRLAALTTEWRDVHSICPHHRMETGYEQLSAFFNVIMILGMNAFTLKGERARHIGLFGQVMLVSVEQYEAVGGHSPVKAEVLENFHLARHFGAAGAGRQCWLGKGTIRMRMYPDGIRDLVAGWSKGIISGAGNTANAALAGVSIWLSGLFMASIPICFAPFVSTELAAGLALVYLLSVVQLWNLFRKAGTYSFWSALTFPVGLIFYHVVFLHALRRKRRGGGRCVGKVVMLVELAPIWIVVLNLGCIPVVHLGITKVPWRP